MTGRWTLAIGPARREAERFVAERTAGRRPSLFCAAGAYLAMLATLAMPVALAIAASWLAGFR